MRQLRDAHRGRIYSEDVNALADEVRRREHVEVLGGQFDDGARGRTLSIDQAEGLLPAKITGEAAGHYSWVELDEDLSTVITGGWSGTTTVGYAYEPNGRTGIPTNTIVLLRPGLSTVSGTDLDQRWQIVSVGLAGASPTVTIEGASGSPSYTGISVVRFEGYATVTNPAAGRANVEVTDPWVTHKPAQGRLTVINNDPSGEGAVNTLYYTPYVGNALAVKFQGSTWREAAFTQLSISNAGLSANTVYDVFVESPSTFPNFTLSLVAWTTATSRATPLVWDSGVLVKSGSPEYRYLGTVRVIDIGGAVNGFKSGDTQRFVWNYYHRQRHRFFLNMNVSAYAYTSGLWRAINNDTSNKVEAVLGWSDVAVGRLEDTVRVRVQHYCECGTGLPFVGIGLDTAGGAGKQAQFVAPDVSGHQSVEYQGYPGIGYHYWSANEFGATGATFNGVDHVTLEGDLWC